MSISSGDFNYISSIVKADSAIVLEAGKEYLVEARLTPIVKQCGLESIEKLVQNLKSGAKSDLRYKVIEALTTNETSFFRDVEPFEILRNTIIPELIEKRKESKRISIWCAASSTGQEPYSIAMLIREHFPAVKDWNISIIATDISKEVLARARKGKFTQLEVNRGLPVTYLVKYFKKEGAEWEIKDDIKKMIRFEELNLIGPVNIISDVDLVMIRNVLIYFDIDTKKSILTKVRKVMRTDGIMFLGAAETTLNIDEQFARRAVGKGSCYTKKS